MRPQTLLSAYRNAIDALDPLRLERILQLLGHAYSYHRAIGFLLETSGHAPNIFERFRKNIRHKFYLTHRMKNPAYSAGWSLHYPKDLGETHESAASGAVQPA